MHIIKKFFFCLVATLLILPVFSYTAPDIGDIDLVLDGTYSAPDIGDIDLILGDVGTTEISTCGDLTTEDMVYLLTADITNYDGGDYCFKIIANNITLDCGGYLVDGNGTIPVGIRNYDVGYNATTIKNCIITDFDLAVDFEYISNLTINNNTIENNSNGGAFIDNSYGDINIFNNRFRNNAQEIVLDSYGEIRNNTLLSGVLGIQISIGTQNVVVYDNSIQDMSDTTIKILRESSNNLFYNNFINATTLTNTYTDISKTCTGTFTNCTEYWALCQLWESEDEECCTNVECGWSGSACTGTTSRDCLYFEDSENDECDMMSECTFDYEKNYFNTTQVVGDRRFSDGTDIGGNYWTNTSGGLSDTCDDSDNDGFCDDIYDVISGELGSCTSDNCDYLAYSDEYVLVPEDTCTYDTGDWAITCSDNCTISADVDLGGNEMIFTGAGYFRIAANISGATIGTMSNNCIIFFDDKGTLIGS